MRTAALLLIAIACCYNIDVEGVSNEVQVVVPAEQQPSQAKESEGETAADIDEGDEEDFGHEITAHQTDSATQRSKTELLGETEELKSGFGAIHQTKNKWCKDSGTNPKNFQHHVKTKADCKGRCEKDAKCKGFVFVSMWGWKCHHFRGKPVQCVLKPGVPAVEMKKQSTPTPKGPVSSSKPASTPKPSAHKHNCHDCTKAECHKYDFTADHKKFCKDSGNNGGTPYNFKHLVKTEDDCKVRCERDAKCKGYLFVSQYGWKCNHYRGSPVNCVSKDMKKGPPLALHMKQGRHQCIETKEAKKEYKAMPQREKLWKKGNIKSWNYEQMISMLHALSCSKPLGFMIRAKYGQHVTNVPSNEETKDKITLLEATFKQHPSDGSYAQVTDFCSDGSLCRRCDPNNPKR